MNEFLRELLFLPLQASTVAAELDALHYFVIITTMVGATLVFTTATVFLIRYRRRGRLVRTPRIQMPIKIEVALIGGTLGLFILWWAIGFVQFIRLQDPPEEALTVYVTGKQWMWKFAFPDGRSSVGVLTVPVGRPVRLVMTSRDVIHSFYVPAFRVKHDVIPGRYAMLWFEVVEDGTYPIYCAEFCGLKHSRMRGLVVALEPAEFEAWLGYPPGQPPLETGEFDPSVVEGVVDGERDVANLVEMGEEIAARYGCFSCHTVDGQPHIGPTWAGLYASWEILQDGTRVFVDEAYLTRSMMDPLEQIVAGFSPVMPTYKGILSAAETAALVEYIRALREVPVEPAVRIPAVQPVEEEETQP